MQLVDMNESHKNFKLRFSVTQDQNQPFLAIVADQSMLDSETPLQFRDVSGSLSGEIIADKNEYQNYFLALKSKDEQPVEVTVQLDLQGLPDYVEPPTKGAHKKKPGKLNVRNALMLIIAICLLAYLLQNWSAIAPGAGSPLVRRSDSILSRLKTMPL